MKRFLALYRREFRIYLYSAHGWVAGLVMLFVPVLNVFRFGMFMQAGLLDLSRLSMSWLAVLSFMIPALTMRVFSEEQKTGIDVLLRTLPVSPTAIVLAKMSAVLTFISMFLLVDLLVPLSLSRMGDISLGLLISHVTGLLLVSCVLVSIGVFVSSLSRSQILSLIGSLIIFTLLAYFDSFAVFLGMPAPVADFSRRVSLEYRFTPFVHGMIDGGAVLYFLGVSAIFVRTTVHSYASRRY